MTIDELARRLDVAGGELAGMRAELERAEVRVDGAGLAGHGAGELVASLRRMWSEQVGVAARVSADLEGLSAGVRAAAGEYRATDREAM